MSVLIRSLRCFSATLCETWPVLALMVTPLAARCEVFFGRNCWGMFCAATPVAPVTALSDLALVLDLPAAAEDEPDFPNFPVEPAGPGACPAPAPKGWGTGTTETLPTPFVVGGMAWRIVPGGGL